MIKRAILIVCLQWVFVLLFSCKAIDSKDDHKNETTEVVAFLTSKNFVLSNSKLNIPSLVIDSLSVVNNEPFKIGDSQDEDKISFSDVYIDNIYEYRRKLHFVLINDKTCLICYTEGGIGSHDVVDYFRYKEGFMHTRYVTTDIVSDTTKLRTYLETNPTPEINKK